MGETDLFRLNGWCRRVLLNQLHQKLERPNLSHHPSNAAQPTHVYEVRPRKDYRGFDLISDVLPFGRLWYGEANAIENAIGFAQHFSRAHSAVIRVCDPAGNVIATHEHNGNFKE